MFITVCEYSGRPAVSDAKVVLRGGNERGVECQKILEIGLPKQPLTRKLTQTLRKLTHFERDANSDSTGTPSAMT